MLGKAIIFKVMEIRACQIARQVEELACDEIKETIKNAKPLPWPPTIDSFLRSSDRKPPKVLTMLLEILLSKNHGKPSASRYRLVDLVSQDVLFTVSSGSFLTHKQWRLVNRAFWAMPPQGRCRNKISSQ